MPKKIKLIQPGEQFQMGSQVFTYSNQDGHIALKYVREGTGKVFVPPTEEQVIAYFNSKQFSGGDKYFQYYNEAEPPWTDKGGNQIKNWQAKARQVWFTPERKLAAPVKNSHMDKMVF